MKGAVAAMVAAAVAMGAVGARAEALDCSCKATCLATGDPHMTDFYGQEWDQDATPGKVLTLYSVDGFAVTALIGHHYRITEVQFGDKSFDTSSCDDPATSSFTSSATIGASGEVTIRAACATADGSSHLNVELDKSDTGAEADFAAMEQAANSSGLCQQGPDARRRLRSRALSSTAQCECSASCLVKGDPHVTDFYGKEETIQNGRTFVLYSEASFTLTIVTSHDGRVESLDFNGATHQAAETCKSKKTELSLDYTWADGDKIVASVRCQEHSSGFSFELDISKSDVVPDGQADNFRSAEATNGGAGLCENLE